MSELFAKVPLDEVSLAEAMGVVDDGSWWVDTMPPILLNFPVQVPSLDAYWSLTVRDHRSMFEWLLKSGVVKNGDQP
jgi:hypothetical protein